MVTQTRLDITL